MEIKLKDPNDIKSTTTEEEHFYFAEGKFEGRLSGEYRGANHPHRQVDRAFATNLQGFIKTSDGGLI